MRAKRVFVGCGLITATNTTALVQRAENTYTPRDDCIVCLFVRYSVIMKKEEEGCYKKRINKSDKATIKNNKDVMYDVLL